MKNWIRARVARVVEWALADRLAELERDVFANASAISTLAYMVDSRK